MSTFANWWAILHRPANLVIAQLRDQRKKPGSSNRDISGLLVMESYKSEAKSWSNTPPYATGWQEYSLGDGGRSGCAGPEGGRRELYQVGSLVTRETSQPL